MQIRKVRSDGTIKLDGFVWEGYGDVLKLFIGNQVGILEATAEHCVYSIVNIHGSRRHVYILKFLTELDPDTCRRYKFLEFEKRRIKKNLPVHRQIHPKPFDWS